MEDVAALRAILRTGRRAFLLNPPADPATDTDVQERKTVRAIVAALEDSGVEKVVALSAYGAQPAERAGDLGVLYGFEQAVRKQQVPASILRAAFYFSNWHLSLDAMRRRGIVMSMFPTGFRLPMVAPDDVGRAACEMLLAPAAELELRHVEGPLGSLRATCRRKGGGLADDDRRRR